jgi:hypothetical protein
LFGVPVELDKNNTARPIDGIWDRGAYEFGSGAGLGDGTGTGAGLTPPPDPGPTPAIPRLRDKPAMKRSILLGR